MKRVGYESSFEAVSPYPCPNVITAPTTDYQDSYGTCGPSCLYSAGPRVPCYSGPQDYGMLKEAIRPYSGSICPYAMFSSGDRRPPDLDFDQNLYSRLHGNEFTDALDPKHRKSRPTSSRSDWGDAHTADSCECTQADIEPCRSPDCKLSKLARDCNREVCPILKVLSFCKDCGGVMVSPGPRAPKNGTKPARQTSQEGHTGSANISSINDSGAGSVHTLEVVKDTAATKLIAKGGSKEIKESWKRGSKVSGKRKKRGRKRHREVLYQYPGVELGHKDCAVSGKHVPRNMGWLWTVKPQGNIKLWRGYKPGAVPKSVHKMMVQHRRDLGIIDPMDYAIRKKRSKSSTKLRAEEPTHAIILKKINGVYTVTVNPVKDPKTLQPSESPFVECTPIQFQIEKEPAPVVHKHKASAPGCPCDETSTISAGSQQLSLSESEIEFYFSPPAAVPDLRPKKKKNMQDIETQYNAADVAGSALPDKKKGGGGKQKKEGKGKKKGKK